MVIEVKEPIESYSQNCTKLENDVPATTQDNRGSLKRLKSNVNKFETSARGARELSLNSEVEISLSLLNACIRRLVELWMPDVRVKN